MTDEQVLTMLAGCPEGATLDALGMHGATMAQLEALVDEGVICRCYQTLRHGLVIRRYYRHPWHPDNIVSIKN